MKTPFWHNIPQASVKHEAATTVLWAVTKVKNSTSKNIPVFLCVLLFFIKKNIIIFLL